MRRGKAGYVGDREGCGRKLLIHALGRCASCGNKARQKRGICRHCKGKRPIHANGEWKPCPVAAYRGSL